MSDCKNCEKHIENECMTTVTMSSADYQKGEQRHERREKRLVWVIVLLIVLLVGSNAAWLVYESQFETVTETTIEATQDGGGINIVGGENVEYVTEGKNNKENNTQEKAETGEMPDLR